MPHVDSTVQLPYRLDTLRGKETAIVRTAKCCDFGIFSLQFEILRLL